MGQLPSQRVTPSAVFSRTGMDFAGPFTIKKDHTRRPVLIKCYICVFVCFSTKASHLEAVSDFTTEAFTASLRRFIARRGLPRTSFLTMAQTLWELLMNLKICTLFSLLTLCKTLSRFLSSQHVIWHFSPERAPHFGGLWEATVKSTKFHLKCVVGAQKLTYEELHTLLCQVECCLNSRPLLPLNSHPDDGVEVLTPGHFLVGRHLQALPELDHTCTKLPLLKRWSLCQALSQHFWKRWSQEYLQQLQRITKWRTPSRNIQPGDVVLIKEDSLVSTHWPMGRIVTTFPGKDGHIRVATVQTQSGIYKRPVAKLVLLLPQDELKGTMSFGGRDVGASQEGVNLNCN